MSCGFEVWGEHSTCYSTHLKERENVVFQAVSWPKAYKSLGKTYPDFTNRLFLRFQQLGHLRVGEHHVRIPLQSVKILLFETDAGLGRL